MSFQPQRRQLLRLIGGGVLAATLPESLAGATVPRTPTLADTVDLGVSFGALGPQLIEAGAIDPERFLAIYQRKGQPLDARRKRILLEGSDDPVVLDMAESYFLLNLFWAAGLANRNRILLHGPMFRGGMLKIINFASTGGWNLATRPVIDVYAGTPLIPLSAMQQSRLEEVAAGVYRPCCDNATDFPDCNHGMAMLGLLALLAAQDRDTDQLFDAAKAANRFWYPQQTTQLATYLEADRGLTFAETDGRLAMGRDLFSGSGFRQVTTWLQSRGLMPAPNGGGGGCST